MGVIRVDLFTTLDGVAQAPGGPDEDPEGGFGFGGWQAPMLDRMVGEWVDANLRGVDALLLGRKTYDIFAAYWPQVTGGPDDGIAALFNRCAWEPDRPAPPRASLRHPSNRPVSHSHTACVISAWTTPSCESPSGHQPANHTSNSSGVPILA